MAGLRRRRRPRVESVNYRRLWWVLTREAALRICHGSSLGTPSERHARLYCSSPDTAALVGIVGLLLIARPERRWWG